MNKRWLYVSALLIALIIILTSGAALADSLGYTLDWWTVDGGGGSSQGGDYSLSGTIGQPDAGAMQGGDYSLAGGFWNSAILGQSEYAIYLPVVTR